MFALPETISPLLAIHRHKEHGNPKQQQHSLAMTPKPSSTSSSSKKEDTQDIGASLSTFSLSTKTAPPAPRVLFHLIRHGQATHNNLSLPIATAVAIPDPPLTATGASQCRLLSENFPRAPYRSKADLILCSPLLRTRLTAYIAFSSVSVRQSEEVKKIVLWPALKELGPGPCNMGLSRKEFEVELDPEVWEDRLVHEGWEGEFCETVGEVLEHVREVRGELFELGKVLIEGGEWKGLVFVRWEKTRDVEVVVVSHGKFLSDLLGFQYQQFHNAEWKMVAFPTEEMMKQDGWQREIQDTPLLRVEVQLGRVKLFRGGKAGSVPSILSPGVREGVSEAARQGREIVLGTEKEATMADEMEDVENDEDREAGGVLL